MIIILPAIILNSKELLKIKEPKNVAVAPKLIKTMEKPKVNRTIGNKLIVFFSNNSFKELPEIYDIYPGINGSTHGDKKLTNPAPNATNNSII